MTLDTAVLTAVASPRRREILRLIWRDERQAGAIHAAMPDVTFGAVSLHLGVLVRAGLAEARRDRRHRWYRARRDRLGEIAPVLEEMWRDALWRLKVQAEMTESRRGPRPRRRGRRHPTPSTRKDPRS